MKKSKIKSKIIIIIMLLFLSTGCTTTLVNKDNKQYKIQKQVNH